MSRFCVAGSINMDLVTQVDEFPKPGETIWGRSFSTFTGGKGANQAVALAKLGADTAMVGRTGNDVYGAEYSRCFREMGINTDGVETADTSTGIAVISVDSRGENCITIVGGANETVSPEYISKKSHIISGAEILLLQLEIPLESVKAAAIAASESGTLVILDPAPAKALGEDILKYVDIITPNETEAEILTGVKPHDEDTFRQAGEILLSKGVKTAVIKAGSRGAYVFQKDIAAHVTGFQVQTTDTTAAGDTFNAGLAYGLGKGMKLTDAVRFANAAAAISTTKTGAQSGMPTYNEAQKLLHQ